MADLGPSILVVDGTWDERMLIASVLREAGFDVVATAHDSGAAAAMSRKRFAAVVVALPDGEEVDFLCQARSRQPDLKALIVVAPTALRLIDEACDTLVKRPLDPRQLLGCMFELVLREEATATPPPCDRRAAEYGIAAAKLACLHHRHAAAAAAGAARLVHDLTRQIGETRSMHSMRAALSPIGGLTVVR